MTVLAITAVDVAMIEEWEAFSGPAAEAITAGQYVRLNTTSGTVELGKATTSGESRNGGIALVSAAINSTVKAVSRGLISVGSALGDLSYDDDVYLSDTDGTLADTAGTVSKVIGRVWPRFVNGSTADKVLRIEL